MSRRRTSSGGEYKLLVQDVADYDPDLTDEIAEQYEKEETEAQPSFLVCLAAFLTVVPVFSGYACGVALQRELKTELGVGGTAQLDASPEGHMFTRAVTLLVVGNLLFRLGHNVAFFCVGARTRVFISISSIMAAMFIISFAIFIGKVHHISLVFVSYGLIGVGIGTFESNLLAEISGLGRRVTLWAVSGMPVGFMLITIGGFVLRGFDVPVVALYLCTAFGLLCSLLLFIFFIPHAPHTQVKEMAKVKHSPKQWVSMIWTVAPFAFCLMIDMFSFSLFCPQLVLYIFQDDYIKMNYLFFEVNLKKDFFIAFVNVHTSFGDTIGRKLVYMIPEKISNKPIFPWLFLIFTALGIGCNVSYIASLTPLGCFFIALGNGTVYAQSCRFIHSNVAIESSIFALSLWLFVGDIGSFVAYLTKDNIQPLFK